MLPENSEELQSCRTNPYINSMPVELVAMIIREYATVSITLQRSSPMNFLMVCPLWRAVGQSRQHLFAPHLIVYGHDELEQLFDLYERHMIPRSIKRLTINLAATSTGQLLDGSNGLKGAMAHIQQDVDGIRLMFLKNWVNSPNNIVPNRWEALNIEQFSLAVKLSAVSAREKLLKAWIGHWISRISREFREREWNGSEGYNGWGCYSYWDQ